jgi:hypothetical protein
MGTTTDSLAARDNLRASEIADDVADRIKFSLATECDPQITQIDADGERAGSHHETSLTRYVSRVGHDNVAARGNATHCGASPCAISGFLPESRLGLHLRLSASICGFLTGAQASENCG